MTNESDAQIARKKPSNGLARAAMWLGGSALFGSLALVLWNLRALKTMREAAEAPDEPVRLSDDDIY
jgi:hypothetical protein